MTTRVVTTEFAIRSFPTSKRLSGRRDSGIDSKCMQQSIGRKGTEEAPIGFHRSFARAVPKPYLLHREWPSFPGYFLATWIFAGRSHRVGYGILRQQPLGNQSGAGSGNGGGGHKISTRKIE